MTESSPWSDAWLLLCIWRSDRGEGTDLASVIGYGDHVNRAILLPDEINGGLARLVARGLVGISSGRMHMTANGHAFCARHEKGSEFTCMERLHGALSKIWAEVQGHSTARPAFTDDEFHEAVRSYRRLFRAAVRGLDE